MGIIVILLIVYIGLELFEIQWQKADNLIGILAKLYRYYRKNIILFFLMHPTFYFGIGLAMITDLAFSAVALMFIKTVDMATQILLIQQVFEKKELSSEMSAMLLAALHSLMSLPLCFCLYASGLFCVYLTLCLLKIFNIILIKHNNLHSRNIYIIFF